MAKLQKLLKYPMVAQGGGIRVLLSQFEKKRLPTVFEWMQQVRQQGKGIGEEEYPPEVVEKQSEQALQITKEDTGELLGMFALFPTPVRRSTNAFCNSGLILIHPEYTGKGIMSEVFKWPLLWAIDKGFIGGAARVAVTSRSAMPTKSINGRFTGVIPYCSYMKGVGWVDDILITFEYGLDVWASDHYKAVVESHNVPLPELQKTETIPPQLVMDNELPVVDFKTASGTYRIKRAEGEEVWAAEELMRNSATSGDGFALDEFTPEGYFNRNFFKETNLAVCQDTKGDVVGCTVFGPSMLTRLTHSTKPVLAGAYMLTDPQHRGRGIGDNIHNYYMDNLTKMGYKGVLSDILGVNYNAMEFYRRKGFSNHGSIPLCAYCAGVGVVETHMVYKDLGDPIIKKLVQ